MGQFQQAGRAREAAHHKVSTQAVADDRDAKIHRDQEQLLSLFRRKELALIAQYAGGGTMFGRVLLDKLHHIHLRRDKFVHFTADAQSGNDGILALGIDSRFQDQHPHATLLIVVGHLHQGGGLAAVHGTVAEI